MASYPKRSTRTPSFTEVVCAPGEQETLRASAAVPAQQQRLVFGPSLPVVASSGGQDPLRVGLQSTQAIVFQDSRALGRLVKPRVLVDSAGELSPGSFVSLIYDYWQPVSVDRKHGPLQHLRIPLDPRYCSTSVFSLSAILTGPGGPVALPSYEWSGSKTAAAVNQHQQRLEYIRTQQKLFTEGEGKDSPNRHLLARSDTEYTIDTGTEWETSPLSLTFNTAAERPWLQRVILRFLVVPKAPVDDNGRPAGDTSAEVTVSSSRVGASGSVEMASASPQPVPQGHTGRQQTGGCTQPSDDTLPQAQHARQADTPSCAAAGSASDTDAECIGVLAAPERKPESSFSSPAVALANSGGAAGSCRRGAAQSTRSAGGSRDPPGSSDSEEEEDAAQGQSGSSRGSGMGGSGMGTSGTGGGTGSGGDREDPGRERGRGQESASANPKSSRKRKEKRESEMAAEASAAEVNGLELQQMVATPSSSPAVPSSSHSHSDRDAAASLQEASSRSTTMDTADASSDAADEHQQGVAESKPTVKLIPNGSSPACGEEGVTGRPPARAAQGIQPCGSIFSGSNAVDGGVGDSSAASEGGVAAAVKALEEARVCKSGCCGGSVSASGAGGESTAAQDRSPSAACLDGVAGKAAVTTKAAEEERSGRDTGLPTGRRKSDDAAPERSVAITASGGGAPPEEAGRAAARPLIVSVDAAGSAASVSGAVDSSCRGAQASSSPKGSSAAPLAPALPPSQQQPQQPRPYPNGATLAVPHAKGPSQGGLDMQQLLLLQQQQQVLGAAATGASHLPHLPLHHAPHHVVHGHHPLQNGKVRNGELLSDPALLMQQLLPALAGFPAGQGGSGSGTPPAAAQPQHQQQQPTQPSAQPHAAYGANGVDATLLQQLLLAHGANGALQMQQPQQQHAGMPMHGQHMQMQSAVHMYNLLLQQQQQQQAQAQQHVQAQHQQHAQAQLMQMFQQPQYQQYAAQQQQQAQQQAQVQQQAQHQHHHQQHQQLFLQGLAQAESQYAVAAPVDAAVFLAGAVQAPGATALPAATAVVAQPPAAAQPAATEPSALPANVSAQQQPSQQQQGSALANVQPLNPTPIVAPTPAVAQMQASADPQSGDSSAGQSGWDTASSTSSVRSEPTTAVAAPLVERPIGQQHRVQSQGNMLAAAHGGSGGGGVARDGGGGRPSSSYRGRTSFSGMGATSGALGGGGGGAASNSGAGGAGPPLVMMQGGGGGAYGTRPYGGPGSGASRHGGGGGHGYGRGGRYDGGSAENSRPSSRGPHPHGGGGGHMRHPHPADPVPPPDSLPLPDHPKGSCDLDRFISQIEPTISIDPSKPPQQALQELRLRDLWNFYFEPSLYGREVFTLGGHRGASNSYFVPYLSAIQIFTRALPTDVGGTNRLYVSEDNQGWPKHMHLKFEYFEQELPFNRLPLYDQIELLSSTMAAAAAAKAPPGRPQAAAPPPPPAATAPSAAAPAPAAAVKEELPAEAASAPAVNITAPPAAISGAEAAPAPADGAAGGDSAEEPKAAAPVSPEAAPNAGGEEQQGALPSVDGAQPAATGTGRAEGRAAEAAAAPASSTAASASVGPSAAAAAQPAQGGSPPAAAAAEVEAAVSNSGGGTGLLYDMRLQDVHPASWFAVAWYPVYRIPDAPLYARFLTFHSFAPLVESMRNVHERLAMGQVAPYYILSLPVVGLNWYNMQGERWMEPLEDARPHAGPVPPPVAASSPAGSVNSPRGPHYRGGGGSGRVSGTDVWYQHLLQSYQSTADRLARGLGLKVLGQHGAEEVRLRVPDYEFFRARS